MLKNYLTIALRNLRRQKVYSFINIAGLAVGMAATLLILLYVQDELSYDRFNERADRIYRVTWESLDEAGIPQVHQPLIDPPVAPLLKATYPEVLKAARLTPVGPLLSYRDRHLEAGNCYWADPEVFDVFTFRFVSGDPRTALSEPFTLVLSRSKARALFGNVDPLGKTVRVNNSDDFRVTGVFEDLPANTHLPIDVLGPMSTLERWFGPLTWDSPNYLTYVLLDEKAVPERLEARLPQLLATHRDAKTARMNRLHLQPLTAIHLHSNLSWEVTPGGSITYVYLFSAIALFILLIACINFMNLATARSASRAKEVGVRKAVGASRPALIRQFLVESILTTVLALLLALLLVQVALPLFQSLSGKDLSTRSGGTLAYLLLPAVVALIVGLLSGCYPAFYLSGIQSIRVLKGAPQGPGRSALRASLVITQFAIAIALISCTVVVYDQLTFVRDRQLGFDKEHVLILPSQRLAPSEFEAFRSRLLQHPDIIDVARSNPVPSRSLNSVEQLVSQATRAGRPTSISAFPAWIDAHFFPAYRIPFVAGRNFSEDIASDAEQGYILNELAAGQLGWTPEEALGQRVTYAGHQGFVVGVVKNFHFESLHQPIAPVVFYEYPQNYRMISVRYRPGANLPRLLAFLEDRWQEREPDRPLDYSFLDEQFGAAYAADRQLGRIFGAFALLAILITCLGLFGLAAFAAEQRTKEIGIRKVLGASVSGIIALLSREFVLLVTVAFLIGVPAAYLVMSRWLEGFAYRIELGPGVFLLAGTLALVVALATVATQAIRAALSDPARSLRYE